MKKILKGFSIVLLSIVLILPLFLFIGCNRRPLKDDGSLQNGTVTSQYGFVNQVGNYIYFINGVENYQANNKYGKVIKGALMRLHVDTLQKNAAAEMVIPELIVSADYKSGLVIHDGYIYYASPNTTKNLKGQIEKEYLNFKCAKLDGTGVRNLARAMNNNTEYRFTIQNGKVYLIYLDSGNKEMHSFDISAKRDTVLVRGYDSIILPEDQNVEAKYVYYTMQVVNPSASKNQKTYKRNSKEYKAPQTFTYRQLYRVEITGAGINTASEKGITTESLRQEGFVAQDNSVLEYCNQGELLYDGISSVDDKTIFNADRDTSANNTNNNGLYGINFQLTRYLSKQNYSTGKDNGSDLGTLFFEIEYLNAANANTRYVYAFNEKKYNETEKTQHNFYPAKEKTTDINFGNTLTPVLLKSAGQSNSVLANAVVVTMGENQQGFAYMMRSGSDSSSSNSSTGVLNTIQLNQVQTGKSITATGTTTQVLTETGVTSDSEVLFVQGNNLYYNANGSSGKKLYKVAFRENNNTFLKEQEGIQFLEIEYKTDWYKPEVLSIGGKEYLFFANASTYGEDYVNVLDTTNLKQQNEDWKKIQDAFNNIDKMTNLQSFNAYRTTTLNLAKFYFYTGLQLLPTERAKFAGHKLSAYYEKLVEAETEQAVSWTQLFIDGKQNGALNFTALPKNDKNQTKTESDFYSMIGERVNGGQSRQNDIATALLPTIPTPTGWTWQWWALFVPLGVAVAGGATFATFYFMKRKKKADRKAN